RRNDFDALATVRPVSGGRVVRRGGGGVDAAVWRRVFRGGGPAGISDRPVHAGGPPLDGTPHSGTGTRARLCSHARRPKGVAGARSIATPARRLYNSRGWRSVLYR